METLTNLTFDELNVGDSYSSTHKVDERGVQLFAVVSGDHNPIHLDAEYAATTRFGERIAHGMYTGALISAVLGMNFPGPGSIYVGQTLEFKRPVLLGDDITVELSVKEKIEKGNRVILSCVLTNQNGKPVVTGEATVIAPTEKQELPAAALPEITIG
ncbi:MAG: MaoC/PaaZ C-terminal domain-containing protein [Oceanobacter sp.]